MSTLSFAKRAFRRINRSRRTRMKTDSNESVTVPGATGDGGVLLRTTVTRLLQELQSGGPGASDRILPYVYDELRRLAQSYLATERPGHTLSATALVHEAYVKLVNRQALPRDKGEFFAIAAQAMRRILVDHARAKKADRRGGSAARVPLDDAIAWFEARDVDVEKLDEALARLAAFDERKARLVELKFFGGLSMQAVADLLDIPLRTAERDWTLARAWLRQEMGRL